MAGGGSGSITALHQFLLLCAGAVAQREDRSQSEMRSVCRSEPLPEETHMREVSRRGAVRGWGDKGRSRDRESGHHVHKGAGGEEEEFSDD